MSSPLTSMGIRGCFSVLCARTVASCGRGRSGIDNHSNGSTNRRHSPGRCLAKSRSATNYRFCGSIFHAVKESLNNVADTMA